MMEGFDDCRGSCIVSFVTPCADEMRLFVSDSARLLATMLSSVVFILPFFMEIRSRQRAQDENPLTIFSD